MNRKEIISMSNVAETKDEKVKTIPGLVAIGNETKEVSNKIDLKETTNISRVARLNETQGFLEDLYANYVDDQVDRNDIVCFWAGDYTNVFVKYMEDKGFKVCDIILDNWLSLPNHDRISYDKQKTLMEKGWISGFDFLLQSIVFDINGIKGVYYYGIGASSHPSIYQQFHGYVVLDRKDIEVFMDALPAVWEYNEELSDKVKEWERGLVKILTWDDIVLREDKKNDIRMNVENFLKAKDFYKEHNLPYKRGFIFVGPPGNGKSMCCNIIKNIYGKRFSFSYVNPDTDVQEIRHIYNAESATKTQVVIIEELDKLTSDERMRSILLDCIDGNSKKQFNENHAGTLTIATANEPDNIHKAFTQRPSRFDRIFKFDNPTVDNKVTLFQYLSQNKYDSEELKKVFEDTKILSYAAVKEVYIDSHLKLIDEKRSPNIDEIAKSIQTIKDQFDSADSGFTSYERSGFRKSSCDEEDD